jgi:hypothetical protein
MRRAWALRMAPLADAPKLTKPPKPVKQLSAVARSVQVTRMTGMPPRSTVVSGLQRCSTEYAQAIFNVRGIRRCWRWPECEHSGVQEARIQGQVARHRRAISCQGLIDAWAADDSLTATFRR